MTLEIIHPIKFVNDTNHPIKVLQNKKTCNLFIKRFSALHLNIFILNAFNKRNFSEIHDKHFMSHF